MEFIGRQKELADLEKEYQRSGSFVVIYGRRRVGKTTLIKEFIRNKSAFYFLATQEVESQSMKRFSSVIARTTGNRMLRNAVFSDWLDLFEVIADYQPETKKVVVIDEFPYLVKTNPAFPSILQNAWDEILKDRNVMLILCGSLLSMMYKHALSYDSPLYGRRTAQFRLAPLSFTEVYHAQSLPFEAAVAQYAVTGGVPKYLEFFDIKRPLMEQIQEVILSKSGFLYEEPDFLLKDEVQSPINYFSILKAVSDGNHKIGAIASVLNLKSSDITPYLSTLVDLGFLKKQVPVTKKSPEKSRKSLYFIADNFIRFWFRYVYPYKGELELDNQQIVLDELKKSFVSVFTAFAYEDICRNLFQEFCASGAIPMTPARIGSYWLNDINNDTEIDVMAVDQQNQILFAGECKYYTKPVDADVYFDLLKKVEMSAEIRKNYGAFKVVCGVFSKSGFTERLLDVSRTNPDLLLIDCDHLITE